MFRKHDIHVKILSKNINYSPIGLTGVASGNQIVLRPQESAINAVSCSRLSLRNSFFSQIMCVCLQFILILCMTILCLLQALYTPRAHLCTLKGFHKNALFSYSFTPYILTFSQSGEWPQPIYTAIKHALVCAPHTHPLKSTYMKGLCSVYDLCPMHYTSRHYFEAWKNWIGVYFTYLKFQV